MHKNVLSAEALPQAPLGKLTMLPGQTTQSDTSLHSQTTDTGLVHRAVCLFTSHLPLELVAHTHGTNGWPGWVDLCSMILHTSFIYVHVMSYYLHFSISRNEQLVHDNVLLRNCSLTHFLTDFNQKI